MTNEETMTNGFARIVLVQLNTDEQLNVREHEAIRVAIKALEQQTCNDAVSREAVLDIFADNADATRPYSTAWEEVKALPSVNPQPKWIPVSERLPEKTDRYLAYIVNKNEDKLRYIMTCDYSVDGYWNWFPDDECASDNVIAWMPLPTPARLEKDNG